MNVLQLTTIQSTVINDHEVRLMVDGVDWFGESTLVLDSPGFFAQNPLTNDGSALVGRCHCGVVGCDDVFVSIKYE